MEDPDPKPPIDYAPSPQPREGFRSRFWRYFYRMSQPTPHGIHWIIMVVVFAVASVGAWIATLVIHALGH
jgi:hypothetical protein